MSYQNHLYVWDDRFLYITSGMASDVTQRHTVTLLVALNDAGFVLGNPNGQSQRYQAALVARHTPRSLDASETALLSLNFDPQSYEHHALTAFLGNQAVRAVILKPGAINPQDMLRIGSGTLDKAALFRLTTELPLAISGYQPVKVPMDMRALHVAQKIKKELPLTSTVADIAAEVGLSPDRLSHLFSDKLGIPIKSYILWARMRRAVELIARGEPLSAIAYDVGFSDSAHLTRTYKQFFGLTPSFVAKAMKIDML
ncbi:helix-turn-helix transcriptional regulator [Halopseudomonas salegens]|uniref:AraC-type DNA-binding protein n=1 Tax=Halopseudomonas salegens TaxID=1434072 RepID=A0A1H2DWR7_9GAMM|nr:helix-turn-helix transcriptional regulator [Halopseudomonas salegens]SDT87291.1 AraC-type DNA-binding protein [Halopseudomonas salegens]